MQEIPAQLEQFRESRDQFWPGVAILVAPAGICLEGEPRDSSERLSPTHLCGEPGWMNKCKAVCGKNMALELLTHSGLKLAPSGALRSLRLVDSVFLSVKWRAPPPLEAVTYSYGSA